MPAAAGPGRGARSARRQTPGASGNPYGGGGHYYRYPPDGVTDWTVIGSGGDAAFRTYVDAIPEPATLTLLALGVAALARRRRK